MELSFKVVTIAGIPIRLHFLFVILLLLWILPGTCNGTARATEESILLLVAMFGSVLLHELGHAFAARQFGAQVLDIMLWPLGGFTRMGNMPERPLPDFVVAIAGPAVNFALLFIAFAFGAYIHIPGMGFFPYDPAADGEAHRSAAGIVDRFAWINAILGASNLLPVFPMDGGRALRAALSAKLGLLRSTEVTVRLSRWLIVAVAIASIYFSFITGPIILIGVFLWFGGTQELAAVRARYGISPLHVLLQKMTGMKIDPQRMEAMRRAAEEQSGRPAEDPPARDAARGEVNEELETFRGTLDEYFRRRKNRDDP